VNLGSRRSRLTMQTLKFEPSMKTLAIALMSSLATGIALADHYSAFKTIPTAAGARTSLFVPELKILCLAVPHRGSQLAEIRVFKTH